MFRLLYTGFNGFDKKSGRIDYESCADKATRQRGDRASGSAAARQREETATELLKWSKTGRREWAGSEMIRLRQQPL